MEQAKRRLLEAGRFEGWTNFGPNMALAKELLEKGERQVVLDDFDLCGKHCARPSRQASTSGRRRSSEARSPTLEATSPTEPRANAVATSIFSTQRAWRGRWPQPNDKSRRFPEG